MQVQNGIKRYGSRQCPHHQCLGLLILHGMRMIKQAATMKTEHLWICNLCQHQQWEVQPADRL